MNRHSDTNSGGNRSLLSTNVLWSSVLPLSPREYEIIRLVASDLTNKEIAAVLEISCWTVSTHLRRIFRKLNVHSKAAMVAHVFDRVVIAQRNHLKDEMCNIDESGGKSYQAARSA